MKLKAHIAYTFIFLFVGFSAFTQTRKELEKKRKELKTEITKVNKLLFETKKKKSNALDDLNDLNKKISVREQFIKTINLETNALQKEINTNKKQLDLLQKQLTKLKADYADMIFKSYKSKSQQSKTMFLLSSSNFYQAYKRLQYMNQYTAFRKKQGEEIGEKTKKIQHLNDSLFLKKQAKDTLILIEKEQKEKIEADQKKQKNLVSSIKKKEQKYKQELQKKQHQEKIITAKIDKIIRDAIASSNKNRKKGVKESSGFILSPEAKLLATKFESNKGKLPWPVKKGLITRKFGIQKHPTIRGITINSTGLHIATEKGSNAQSIFNGKVLGVQLLSEGKKSVLVQHGSYVSAYNNLEKIYVKKGDKISTGQDLGQIFTDKVTGKTTLIFALYKNTKKLNPSDWILKQ
ncbi:murein hydrolase activator EnvC [Tenacibaculum sp. UWU-22]|uniref:murein hydrolase activator EnvC family protein n=1 Tax=Tenacibaculum sp. UWU-22 TaxID=3234187 RepID=UPI0034DB6998